MRNGKGQAGMKPRSQGVGTSLKSYLKNVFSGNELDDLSAPIEERPADRIRAQAKSFLVQGEPLGAASLLAESKLYTDAGQLLKTLGFAQEAAQQFIKAGAWDRAEQCFWTAGDRRNAARCAMKQGKYDVAVSTLEKLEDFALAAECRAKLGDWRTAASHYYVAGKYEECATCFGQLLRQEDFSSSDLTEVEMVRLITAQGHARLESFVLDAIESHDLLPLLVTKLLENSRQRLAVELFGRKLPQLGTEFLEWAGDAPENSERALDFAKATGDAALAAKLYERAGRYEEAIDAFRAVGDLENAIALCMKHEKWDLMSRLKAEAAKKPQARAKAQPAAAPQAAPAVAKTTTPPSAATIMSTVQPFSLDALTRDEAAAPDVTATVKGDDEPTLVFSQSNFFKRLKEADRTLLWRLGSVKEFKKGATLVNFDEHPAGTFTLLGGSAVIIRRSEPGEVIVDTIHAGRNFGESWLLSERKSEVKVVAAADCVVHIVEKARLIQAVDTGTHASPALMRDIAEILMSHLLSYSTPRGSHGTPARS